MKVNLIIAITCLLWSCQSKEEFQLELYNPIDVERAEEGLVISRSNVPGAEKYPNLFPLFSIDNQAIEYQLDDLDQDGQWDQAFLLVDINALDTLTLDISYSKKMNVYQGESRTNIRFGNKNEPYNELSGVSRRSEGKNEITSTLFQMEGPAWENDNVGFRNYYDARNGIDIFGKIGSGMVLDQAGIKGQNYHQPDEWGMDVLKVGSSLGAGAIVIKEADSLYRWSPTGKGSYNLISDGPLRAIFELNFEGWETQSGKINVSHRISIAAGTNYYKSEVFTELLKGSETLTTGIVKLKSDSLYLTKSGKSLILSTHDKQAEDKSYLGIALIIAGQDFISTDELPYEGHVSSTYTADLKLSKDEATTFYLYSGWAGQDAKFEDPQRFIESVKSTSQRIFNPLVIL